MLRKSWNGIIGLISALFLNSECLWHRMHGKKVLIFQIHGATQLPHVESLLDAFQGEQGIVCYLLTPPKERHSTKAQTHADTNVRSYDASLFLLWWDAVIAVDQGMRLPLLNLLNGHRVCMFHGQPSKGNSYLHFNHRYFDDLFFYGPMMKQKFVHESEDHPEWLGLQLHDIGQPKSDKLFALPRKAQKQTSREKLNIDKDCPTVIYAPSFERCASFATMGAEIATALNQPNRILIVKPHPSFYRVHSPDDPTYFGVPHVEDWQPKLASFPHLDRLIFPLDEQLETDVAISAADVLVTDHSGIAFDAILLDIPVIYFHCPEFFDSYLPEQFGVDGHAALKDIACNAGRSAGVVVDSVAALQSAVEEAIAHPELNREQRKSVSDNLLFNAGKATDVARQKILKLITND